MRKIWEVISHYEKDLVNFGNHNPQRGNRELYSMEYLKETKSRIAHVVFKDQETLKACLKELKNRDFGISVVISGLYDDVEKICSEVGLLPHTVNCSLGIHGRTERLPAENVLEITTMCGHAMVSPNLVIDMVDRINRRKITHKNAVKELSRMCDCGVFNSYRAEKLLRRMTTR